MLEAVYDALVDTAKMIPLLLLIYYLIEIMQGRYSTQFQAAVKKAGKAGPLWGTILGILPQCGFSVICTALYTKRVISTGTLLSVYLATSDEAIPIILSQPGKAGLIMPILATKVGIALVAGYLIDFVLLRRNQLYAGHETAAAVHNYNGSCCHRHHNSHITMLLYALQHTFKVFCFIFAVSLIINVVILQIGEANLGRLLLRDTLWQPVIAAAIGLIPNCAASVVITEMFLQGAISFGSVIAGLSASAGLGLLVLIKEERNLRTVFMVIILLLFISITAGTTIQSIYG